ncbi:MAG: hypothetical protein NTZ97_00840 [Candidatus Moranbacteria bacterium]|nr:hypothetical protein [Candidatus Moranbacteria bacterium]
MEARRETTIFCPHCEYVYIAEISESVFERAKKKTIVRKKFCSSCHEHFYALIDKEGIHFLAAKPEIEKPLKKEIPVKPAAIVENLAPDSHIIEKAPAETKVKKPGKKAAPAKSGETLILIRSCTEDLLYKKYFPGEEQPMAVSRQLNDKEIEAHRNTGCGKYDWCSDQWNYMERELIEIEKENKKNKEKKETKIWKSFSCKECSKFISLKETIKISAI